MEPMISRVMGAVLLSLIIFGCVPAQEPVTTRNSTLTQGNVQLHLKVGETTKAEVLNVFGSPNVTTRQGDGLEIWSYQRSAQVSQSTSQDAQFTIFLAGATGSSSGFQTSSRMVTLIIYFDARDVVVDFKSRTSDF